jgi:MFS-type transporter involved in bile tolerance (Atg22 family)
MSRGIAGRGLAAWLPTRLDTAAKPRISWQGMLVLAAFWFAIAYLNNTLVSFVIPRLVQGFLRTGSIHPVTVHVAFVSLTLDKNSYVALLDTFGALFAVVWQPAIGSLSDRNRARVGRRRPFIFIGVLGDMVFLTLMAFVTSYWGLMVAYAFFQMASNTVQGPYQGMLPDQVPADQRSEASGYYGGVQLIGTLVGFIVIGALFANALPLALFSCVAVAAVAGAIVLRGVPDVRTTRIDPRPIGKAILLSFAFDVRRYRDFAWLMGSRLLFLMGPAGVITYALYFLQDTFHRVLPGRIRRRAPGKEATGRGRVRGRRPGCRPGDRRALNSAGPCIRHDHRHLARHIPLGGLGVHDRPHSQGRGRPLHGPVEHRDR